MATTASATGVEEFDEAFHKGSFVKTVVLEGLGDSEPFGEDEGDGLSAEGSGPRR